MYKTHHSLILASENTRDNMHIVEENSIKCGFCLKNYSRGRVSRPYNLIHVCNHISLRTKKGLIAYVLFGNTYVPYVQEIQSNAFRGGRCFSYWINTFKFDFLSHIVYINKQMQTVVPVAQPCLSRLNRFTDTTQSEKV